MVDDPADLRRPEERSDLAFRQPRWHSRQPVAAPAGGLDDVPPRPERVEALEQLGARHVELVAEHRAGDEVVVALEQHAEDERVLTVIGPMRELGLAGGGRDQRAQARPSTTRLRSTAGAECVRAPTET